MSLLTTAIIVIALVRLGLGLRSKQSYHDPALLIVLSAVEVCVCEFTHLVIAPFL